jgi:hypothetical protein
MYAKGTHDIIDRREHLRIKVKSLAEEARIIRRHEQRLKYRRIRGVKGVTFAFALHTDGTQTDLTKPRMDRRLGGGGPLVNELSHHRRTILRKAARHAHLAYGFVRYIAYERMEAKVLPGNAPDWTEVYKLMLRYGAAKPSDLVLPACFPNEVHETHAKLVAKSVTVKRAA